MHVIRKLVAVLALAAACSAASAANKLVIDPAVSVVGPGRSFILQVLGTDFADIVIGGGFDLSFDADLLSLDEVTINTALWDFAPSSGDDSVAGLRTDVSFNTLFNSPTGDFLAATLSFTAKAPGVSPLTLSGSNIFVFSNSDGQEIDVDYGVGSVTIAAVPEPAAVATMLLGLGLLGIVRLRRPVDPA